MPTIVQVEFAAGVGPSGIPAKRPPAGAYLWLCTKAVVSKSGDIELDLKSLDSSNPEGVGLTTKVWENRSAATQPERMFKARTGAIKSLMVCAGKPYAQIAPAAGGVGIDLDYLLNKRLYSWFEPKNPDASDIKGHPSYEQGFDQNRWLWTTGNDAAGEPVVDPAGAYEQVRNGNRVIGLENSPLRVQVASAAQAAAAPSPGPMPASYAGPPQGAMVAPMTAQPPNNGVAVPASVTARPADGAIALL
jgi:hypothetical protein